MTMSRFKCEECGAEIFKQGVKYVTQCNHYPVTDGRAGDVGLMTNKSDEVVCAVTTGKVKSLCGKRFGKLVAKELLGVDANRSTVWNCECDCGGNINASAAKLNSGKVRSCGCLMSDIKKAKTHNDYYSKRAQKDRDAGLGAYRS